MGEQSNGFDQNGRATANAPEMDIPILKKQEKEKKGAGAVLTAAAPQAAALVPGVGVGLLTGKLGLAALALGLCGAGVIGVGMYQQNAVKPAAAPQLDALSSSIAVGRRSAQGSKSLAFMAEAGAGQLKWENPNAPKSAPEKTADAPADKKEDVAGAEAPAFAMPEGAAGRKRMANDMAGSKLSSSLGGAQSGAFGKNNIFSKGTGFNTKSLDLKSKSALGDRSLTAQRGKLGGQGRNKSGVSVNSMSTSRIDAGKSIGQLKFAGTRSAAAAAAGDAGAASTYASDAFDQQKTNGGQLEATSGGPAGGLGTVSPVGAGAPDATGNAGACPSGWTKDEGGGCTAPDITNGQAMTNYQNLLDGVMKMQQQATQMMMLGMGLIAAGAILMVAGWPGWGAIIGAVLIALGIAFLAMAQMMNKQADQMADQIGSMYQQKKQADILKDRGAGDSSTPELDKDNVDKGSFEDTKAQCSAAGGTLTPTDDAFQPYKCVK